MNRIVVLKNHATWEEFQEYLLGQLQEYRFMREDLRPIGATNYQKLVDLNDDIQSIIDTAKHAGIQVQKDPDPDPVVSEEELVFRLGLESRTPLWEKCRRK